MMDDHSSDHDDAQIYAAVHGVTPSGAPADELGTSLRSVRNELCTPPDAQARWNHLAAMRRAQAGSSKRRKGRSIVAIAAATVGLVTVTTGLAAADRLPGPAQDRVARIAEIVGVDLPGNEGRPAASPDRDADHGTRPSEPPGAPGAESTGSTTNAGGGASPDGSGSTSETPLVIATMPPGRSGATPPQGAPPSSVTPPGQSVPDPGESGNAPGQDTSGPGQSESAPGQTGETPGKSGLAPGHAGTAGKPATTPAATAGAG